MTNIIEVSFGGGSIAYVKVDTAYFYNNGILFKPTDIDLPASYQVHWADSPQASSTLETIGTAEGAPIPDDLWNRSRVIYGWIYLHPTEDSAVTYKEVRIYKNARAGMPDGTEPTPAEQSVIDQAISALNTAVAQTAQDVISTDQSARSASGDADRAERARTGAETAQGKAEEAQESAERAKDDAETSERNASESERQAKGYADTASEKANSIHSMTAQATTLPDGSSATASYNAETGVMSFGIPKGKDGRDGTDGTDGIDGIDGISPSVSVTDITGGHRVVITDKDGAKSFDVEDGATGATPNLTIGTVTTLEPDASATASITGTAENPVLNLGLPKGQTGEVTEEEFTQLKEDLTQLEKAYIVNLFDPTDNTYVENAYIDGSGNVVEANGYFISNHIPVNSGDTFVATYASATGTTSVRVYSKAGVKQSNVTGTLSDDGKYITFTIPSTIVNAAYMTVNGRTALTEFMIIKGSVYPSFYIQKYALDEDVRLKASEDFLEVDKNVNSMSTVLGYVPAGTKSVATSNAKTGYFVNATNNRVDASFNFNITNSIRLYRGQTISVIAQGYLTAVAILSKYYADDDVYATVVASTDSTLKTYTWTADEDCYVRCSYNKTATPVVTVTTAEDFMSVIRNIEAAMASGEESKIEYPQLFDNVLCIGDSLTVGYDGSGDTPLIKNYPHFIEKLMVCDTGMKAHGGWSAKEVWDDDISTAVDLDSYDCAIIFLGTNGGLTDTVDTDCKQDYTQNTDNNTGCYGKIIGKIKADAPNCRIFCVAGVNDYIRRATTMNPAVRALASFYNVGLIDIENCIMSDNGASGSMERFLYRPIDGIHYNALGYMTMANMFYDSMREFMSNHRTMYDDYNSN